ncbi:uncharacterized protein MELLADRAFT_112283 [Melampsora larici-populina 98AG31]|uniref:Uncharacterized protein n=1 Tax=Melampsora larici-populina (strain 98AG31 / pathotype 3-4-7) TaxID=747676 RepID=F4S5Z8_MELLP|nr:uncharacterized protein MELLADRAFT_112283 [Melampsora larici-populina 98AG31]EGF99929.1 hypothetical protein MELLADRAFT_112283 [Melampsora larici-populina 98AG31]
MDYFHCELGKDDYRKLMIVEKGLLPLRKLASDKGSENRENDLAETGKETVGSPQLSANIMPDSQRPNLRTRDSRSASPPLRAEALPASLRFVGSNTSQSNTNNNGGRKDEEDDSDEEMEPGPQQTAHSPTPTPSPPHQSPPLDPTNRDPFRSAQAGIPSTNLPMARADRAQWNQIADIFELDSKHRAEALRISSITGSENQYHASVCLLQKTRQDMDNVVAQLRSTASWKPAADLGLYSQTRLTKIIRETLQDHTMESYTYKVDPNKKMIQRSFEKIAMNAIINQSNSWKSENLPQDFGTTLTDLKRHEAFMKFFGAKVRHVRDDFRIALLNNMIVTHSNIDEPAQPVPKLSELLLLLTRFFNPQDPRTAKEVDADMDPKAKARYAYLVSIFGTHTVRFIA